MVDRLRCCVPFCRRTRGLRKGDRGVMPREWLCGDHWPLVPALRRKIKRRADRAWHAAWAAYESISAEGDRIAALNGGMVHTGILDRLHVAHDALDRCQARCDRLWAWCKRMAIERVAGI